MTEEDKIKEIMAEAFKVNGKIEHVLPSQLPVMSKLRLININREFKKRYKVEL